MEKIDSDFAILDVMRGRAALAKRVAKGERIPVTIRGYLNNVNSHDDGVSIEIALEVTDVYERSR
jgi:hypothetical protein